MARKKEYSVADGCAKKRVQPNYPNLENKKNVDNSNIKSNPLKRKDSNGRAGPSCSDVYDVADLRAQLGSIGLTLRDIPGDGNCLFRALGDQLEGHSRNHMKHRMDTVRYMIENRKHFEPFIDIPFDRYIDNLSRPGTYAGQDSLVAFARLHEVNIVIHQLNSPLWQIEGSESEDALELHLSYHNGEHYSSVRHFGDLENTPAHVRVVSLTSAEERPCCVSLGKKCAKNKENVAKSDKKKGKNNSFASHSVSETAPLAIPEMIMDDSTYAPNEEDFNTLVEEVMMRSNYRDRALATEAFIDNGCDVVQTVDYLISLSLIWHSSQKNDRSQPEEILPEPIRVVKSDPLINDFAEIQPLETHTAKPRRQSSCINPLEQGDDVILSSDLRFLTL